MEFLLGSVPCYLILAVGSFCVLYGIGILLKQEKHNLKESFKSFKIGMASTFRRGERPQGETKLATTVIVVVCCLALITVPAAIALAKYFSRYPIYTIENVKVLSKEQSNLPGYTYWMEYRSESMGQLQFIARFCSDYQPPFDPGDFLVFLRYEDHRDCWSLRSDYAGVKIRRDEHGRTDSELRNERSR